MRREQLGIGNLFDQMRDALIVADATTGRIVLWNAAAEAVFGYSEGEAVGRMVEDLVPEGLRAEHRAGIARYAATGHGAYVDRGAIMELPGLRKDGTEFHAEISLHPAPSEMGGGPFVVALVRDITEQKRLEEQLEQSQRIEAIGLLASGVAHDFNNLLQAILGFSELALQKISPDDQNYMFVQEISHAGQRGAALTRQLLAFGRRQQLSPEILDLNHVIGLLEHTMRALMGPRINLITQFDPVLRRIEADSTQLDQIVLNLVTNARDAMPGGGEIRIETKNVVLDDAGIRSRWPMTPGPYAMMQVRDNGQGMDEQTKAHIFEPFFTTKAHGKGTGLGLASVYGIVKQSRGYIWVDSSPGHGATFTLYFPPSERDWPVVIEPPEVQLGAQPTGETILVVDDEQPVLALAQAVLKAKGYGVLQAHRAEEALLTAEQYPEPIHLLITDVLMPGISGPELARRLRAQRPDLADLKVLYMSGYSQRMIEPGSEVLDVISFLQKPFTPAALLDKVVELLASKTPAGR